MDGGHVTMFSRIILEAIGISSAIKKGFEMNIPWSLRKSR